MSASNEVRFRLAADTSSLSSAFVKAQSIAAVAGKSMGKSFELKNVFNKTVLALGISIENIAEKIANVFSGGSAQGFTAALAAAEQHANILEEASLARLTTLRQIEVIEARIAQNQAATSPDPRKEGELSGWRKMLFDSPGGREVMRRTGLGGETDDDAMARRSTALARNAADAARVTALKEKQVRAEERIAQARRELANIGIEGQDKINASLAEVNISGERLEAARLKRVETVELELDFVNKLKAAKQTILEVERQSTMEQERRERMQVAERDEILKHYRDYLEAKDDFNAAKAEDDATKPKPRNLRAEAREHQQALMRGEMGAGPANIFDPRYKFKRGENATPPTAWDLNYGDAIKSRGASMSGGIDARNQSITMGIRARNFGVLGMPGQGGGAQNGEQSKTQESNSKLDAAAQKLEAAAQILSAAMTPRDVK